MGRRNYLLWLLIFETLFSHQMQLLAKYYQHQYWHFDATMFSLIEFCKNVSFLIAIHFLFLKGIFPLIFVIVNNT